MKKVVIFLTLLIGLSACKNPFEAVDISMKKAWAVSQGQPNAIDCSQSGDRSFIDGFEHIVFDCKLNIAIEGVELLEIFNGKLGKYPSYAVTVIGGENFEAKNYKIENDGYISDNPALSPYGLICATTDCPKNTKFNSGHKFKTVFSTDGWSFSRKLKLQYALWDGRNRVWLGKSQSFALTIPADPELAAQKAYELEIQRENQEAADRQFADEQVAKDSFDEGYAFIWENSADFLVTMPGLLTSFDIKGNPIKREMNEFCKNLYSVTLIARGHLTSSRESARNEWNKGCFKAAMKITLSDLNRGND